jgi:hypothetical protein
MKLRGKVHDDVEKLDDFEIKDLRENNSNALSLYHLHRNLKRKLLNKLIYKFTSNLFEKKKLQKSLSTIDRKSE